jgi:hypothetical protein
MAWVILAGVAIALIVLAFWAGTRRGPVEPVGAGPRFDLVRSGLAFVAAAIALVAVLDAYADPRIEFAPIGVVFGLAAAASASLALVPSRGAWSDRRRIASAIVAGLWAALGLAVGLFAEVISTCSCAAFAGPNNAPSAAPGIDASGWFAIATLGGPLLLLLAASRLPDRLRRTAA